MADSISATPRNKLLGLLADSLGGASDWVSQDNPPVRGLLNLLGVPAVTSTLNELSYGGALGTGSGMTWKPKADTLDAAMAVAPLVSAAPAMMNRGAAYAGKALEPAVNRLVDRTMSQGGRGAQMLTDMAQGTQSPLTVWHGSPHKFDAFDASKIGTGEGAQAYGHGLYLAESRDVADMYRKKLTPSDAFVDGEVLDSSIPKHMLARVWNEESGNIAAVKDSLEVLSRPGGSKSVAASAKEALQLFENGQRPIVQTVKPEGSLYKVDLPDEHIAKMLDWDKPLSQQHPDVQKMLEPLGYSSKAQVSQYEDDLLAALNGDSSVSLPQIRDPMGSEIARGGSVFDGQSQIGKATRLKELGIPGIRYLDGGSRASGGTSNFVVFPGNEGLLNIMERNGQSVAKGLLPSTEPFVYPRQAALDTAQRNAALPVEQGGLGLAAGNTPMERATLMFPNEGFHGTPDNRLSSSRQFKDEMLGKSTQVADAAKGHYSATTGDAASEYIWRNGSTEGGNVLPLRLSGNRDTVTFPGEWQPGRFDSAIDQARAGGYEGLNIQGTTTLGKPGDYQVTFNPANIRSRFAAFDPFQRNSPDILAGMLPLTAMSDPDMRRGLLGQ